MAGITVQQGAGLSDRVYDNLSSYVGTEKIISDGNGASYYVRDFKSNSSTDFQAAVFQNTETNEYVVAFRGTEPTGNDLLTDLQMGIGQFPQQFVNAHDYIGYVKNKFEIDASNCIFVGHSLGGAIAEYAGMITGFQTYTYNAYGIGNIYDGLDVNKYHNIDNYVTFNDFVSRLPTSEMVGDVFVVGDGTYDAGYGHSISNFTMNTTIFNTIRSVDDSQDSGRSVWKTLNLMVSDGCKVTTANIVELFDSNKTDLKSILHLNDASGVTDEQLLNALLMASIDGTSTINATGIFFMDLGADRGLEDFSKALIECINKKD